MAATLRSARFPKRNPLFLAAVVLFLLALHWVLSGGDDTLTGANATRNKSRVAIVTFTTQESSYTHLSLRNKKGKWHYASMVAFPR
jgi:hypothetical protein